MAKVCGGREASSATHDAETKMQASARMKPEIRNPKSERNPKAEARKTSARPRESWLLVPHPKSGAEATPLQTLRGCSACSRSARRLERGAFAAAFGRAMPKHERFGFWIPVFFRHSGIRFSVFISCPCKHGRRECPRRTRFVFASTARPARSRTDRWPAGRAGPDRTGRDTNCRWKCSFREWTADGPPRRLAASRRRRKFPALPIMRRMTAVSALRTAAGFSPLRQLVQQGDVRQHLQARRSDTRWNGR